MKVRYRDLSVHDPVIQKELLNSVKGVLDHGKIILGPEVDEFEKNIANYCGTKYAIGVSCGTNALYLSLKALGVGVGDEVITTPLSWIATVNAIALTGAVPVFVDIGQDLNIDPELIEEAVTDRTKAIVPVHFTGRLCKMDRINEVAKKNGLFVIEDAAQSFGAKLNGTVAGAFGDMGCFSMNPMKVFCSYGEAGAIVTDNDDLYPMLMSYRNNGVINKENCHTPSINARIETIQAAMMNVNLKCIDKKIEKFRSAAIRYNNELKDIVVCPPVDDTYHTYYSYTILVDNRDSLVKYLDEKGIETKIQHPILMPYHTAYDGKYKCHDLRVAEKVVDQILCLPNHDLLHDEEIAYVIDVMKEYYV